MLANPPAMSRLPHHSFPSWDNSRPFHSTYAPAGPSTYAQQAPSQQPQQQHRQAQPSWASNVAGPSSQPINNSHQSPDSDKPASGASAMITADGTVYAATGRKRKRLQKACVACHKAKRRCDGGLPCSNCDFSGRTCCYSDANGKMVLPTARAGPNNAAPSQPTNRAAHPAEVANAPPPSHAAAPPPPSPSHNLIESRSMPVIPQQPSYSAGLMASHDSMTPSAAGPGNGQRSSKKPRTSLTRTSTASPSQSPRMATSPLSSAADLSEVPPERRRELISIFFSQLHPFSSVIDEISFLRDLSTSEVSPALLFSMYALSARFQQDVEEHHRFAAGEMYARSARAMLSEEDAQGCSALERPGLDTAIALCLLAAHEAGMGRLHRALSYSSASVRMVMALRFHEGAMPEARHMPYSRDSFSSNARRNSSQRLVCVAWSLDILIASLVGQPASVRADEIDASLANLRANTTDDVNKAFFSMTQVFGVLVRVLDHARTMRAQQAMLAPGKGLDKAALSRAREGVRRCEESLHTWAKQLTADEGFDEVNLSATTKVLAEADSSPMADKASCWAMMHMVAESLMFILHSSTPVDDNQSRQEAAYKNLGLILDAFGPAGRQSLFAFPALLICTEYPARSKLNVSRWFNQARECWALTDAQIGEAAVALCVSRQVASPALSLPPPPSHHRSGSEHHHHHHHQQQQPGHRQPQHGLPRHHASASGSMLPSLGSLPLPSLRLSPPTSAGARNDVHERPSLSPIGLISSPTDLPSWRVSTSSQASRASPSSTEQDGAKTPPSTGNAGSFELYASNAATRSPPSAVIRSASGAGSDPRSAWSPITSLRGDKRSIANVSQ